MEKKLDNYYYYYYIVENILFQQTLLRFCNVFIFQSTTITHRAIIY